MPMRELRLGQVRKLVAGGKIEETQVAGLDGWPDDQLLSVACDVSDEEIGKPAKADKKGRKPSAKKTEAKTEPAKTEAVETVQENQAGS